MVYGMIQYWLLSSSYLILSIISPAMLTRSAETFGTTPALFNNFED